MQRNYVRQDWLRIASKMQASCSPYAFHASTHHLHHIFSTMLFLLERVTHFCKTTSSNFNQNVCCFDPQPASTRAFFVIVFALFASLAVPIAICSLHARIKILLLAAVPCIFRPQSPVSKNECMHRCNNFVNFVYDLLFLVYLPCCEHLFYKISSNVLKICSPPSVGSMILKTAPKQHHEKYASWAVQLGSYALFLHHYLQPEIFKIHEKNVYFLFLSLIHI